MPIDSYCLFNSSIFNQRLNEYFELLHDETTRVIRYENFLYNKMFLVDSICDWFQIGLSQNCKQTIAASVSYIPDVENPLIHIRQAHPGDYKHKLQPQTIDALNALFARFLTTFGYVA